jgi:hypothetical protein
MEAAGVDFGETGSIIDPGCTIIRKQTFRSVKLYLEYYFKSKKINVTGAPRRTSPAEEAARVGSAAGRRIGRRRDRRSRPRRARVVGRPARSFSSTRAGERAADHGAIGLRPDVRLIEAERRENHP